MLFIEFLFHCCCIVCCSIYIVIKRNIIIEYVCNMFNNYLNKRRYNKFIQKCSVVCSKTNEEIMNEIKMKYKKIMIPKKDISKISFEELFKQLLFEGYYTSVSNIICDKMTMIERFYNNTLVYLKYYKQFFYIKQHQTYFIDLAYLYHLFYSTYTMLSVLADNIIKVREHIHDKSKFDYNLSYHYYFELMNKLEEYIKMFDKEFLQIHNPTEDDMKKNYLSFKQLTKEALDMYLIVSKISYYIIDKYHRQLYKIELNSFSNDVIKSIEDRTNTFISYYNDKIVNYLNYHFTF